MYTILVTGASGFVGSRFIRRWESEYHILAPSHSELDITSDISVEHFFAVHRPSVVLHLAAISNTWYCEQHPDESRTVNVEGAVRVARAAASCGAKFVFFSSDQIYNGNLQTGPLCEDVAVAPETVYARDKLLAEQLIANVCPDAVMLRATWMYDADISGLPLHANFVSNISRAIHEHKSIFFPVREYRGITWVREVVEYLPHTFLLPAGVYNFGAQNRLNTYETACCYIEMMDCGRACDTIVAADAERFTEHERNIAISNEKVFQASGGYICFSDTVDGLRFFLASQKQ
ncbi:MAG: sugar nucleotide-binding protein [Bacteroidaceae bacterium]|nr:sugar nucleotide-binding protein [Bacteroidaceae bacterium]